MKYPFRDQRYSIGLEYCGHVNPRHVARFCGEWIGQSQFYSSAVMLCAGYDAIRKGSLVVQEVRP